MDTGEGPKRKKLLRLEEQDWKLIRTFVEKYFEQHEKAAKATYEILFSDIKKEYPDYDLHKSAFKNHIGTIEELKRVAGLVTISTEHLSKEYLHKLNEAFLQVLISLTLKEFLSIKFEDLIQRAHISNPDLKINEKNKKTLAGYFPIKGLKNLARGKRPAEAAVSLAHSGRAPEAPAAQVLAAAAIDGPHIGKIQGRRDGRFRPQKRPRRNKGPWDMSSDPTPAADDEGEHSPRASEPSPPANQNAAIDLDIHAAGTQLAARDGPDLDGATKCLTMLCEYSSGNDQQENLSSNAHKENPSSTAHTADRGQADCVPANAGDDGTCISCLIFWNI